MYSAGWPILFDLNAVEGTEKENERADCRKSDPHGLFWLEVDPELGLTTADGCTYSYGWRNSQSNN